MLTTVFIIASLILLLSLSGQRKPQTRTALIINCSSADVWAIMGKQFSDVHLWSSNFKASKPGGTEKFSGIDYSFRATQTDRGETIQVLDTFDSENYRLAYHITKGIPTIAKSASAVWSLRPINSNQTEVILEFDMEVKNAIGYLLSPLIKLKIAKSAREIAEELKYYMENGNVHPRKTKMD